VVPAPLISAKPRDEAARPPTEAVVIGGSAGAVAALGEILPGLPFHFPAVLVAIHVLPSAPTLFPEIFAPRCSMRVREAGAFDPIDRGTIYFAPADYHLLVEAGPRCALSVGPPVNFSRPSIDVFFESAAEIYGAGLVGVALTGASDDGAHGLRAIGAAGGTVLVQDPATAEVDVLPRACLRAVPSAQTLNLAGIFSELVALGRA
jgi:two-component system chemotaxis response regulator CheB